MVVDSIRFEKKNLMTKRLLIGKAVEYADMYFKMLDDIGSICSDGGMDESYGRTFFLEQLIEDYGAFTPDSDEESDDDEA